jgi:hypothetical protein
VPTRFIILLILLPAIVLGVGSVPQAVAQNPAADGNSSTPFGGLGTEEEGDSFVMPKLVDPPPFDPITTATLIEGFRGEDGEAAVEVDETAAFANPSSMPAELPVFSEQSPAASRVDTEFFDDTPFVDDTLESVYPLEPTPDVFFADDFAWSWQVLPDGLLYKSYLAGTRESRISGAMLYDTKEGWLFDATLGGRTGILRYGSPGASGAEGWQLDVEGAAFVRLNSEEAWDVDSVDFRFGVPLTYRRGRWQWKTGYYHLSAHVGDEFLARNPGFRRINYVRDAVFFGLGYFPVEDIRLYGEIGWAFKTDDGAEPLEFQFGADYNPAVDDALRGAPYAAINVHLREEVDFGGGVNLMAGWQWTGPISGSIFRAGLQYYNGKKTQYSFYNQHEELIGVGLWYDY